MLVLQSASDEQEGVHVAAHTPGPVPPPELDDDVRDLVKAKAPARAYREIYIRRRLPSLRRAGKGVVAVHVWPAALSAGSETTPTATGSRRSAAS